MLRFLIKIWPALTPILVYIFWVLVIDRFLFKKLLKKKNKPEAQKTVGAHTTEIKEPGIFSLQNHCFVIILYMSLILAILALVLMAF